MVQIDGNHQFRRFFVSQDPLTPSEEKAPAPYEGPKKDYSLKEGQTFKISIPGKAREDENQINNLLGSTPAVLPKPSGGLGGGVPLLPPPPSSKK
jgi:hypothetical protein